MKANEPSIYRKSINIITTNNQIVDDSYSKNKALISTRERQFDEKNSLVDLNLANANKFRDWLQNQIDESIFLMTNTLYN